MAHCAMPAAFQKIYKTRQVRIHISMGVLQRISYTGLGGKVDHDIETIFLKNFFQVIPVGQIAFRKSKIFMSAQLPETVLLEPNIVIRRQIIDPGYVLSVAKQPFRKMKPDEAGGAGYQNSIESAGHESLPYVV